MLLVYMVGQQVRGAVHINKLAQQGPELESNAKEDYKLHQLVYLMASLKRDNSLIAEQQFALAA